MNRDFPSEGRMERGQHIMPVRVYFEDTDLTQVVYHANYLRYMERARTEMLRFAGIVQTDVMAAGTGYYAVHNIDITYHRPARLDDRLTVVSTVTLVRAAATHLSQKVLRGPDLICAANVTAAFLDMDGRPRRQAKLWHDHFTALMQQAATN